MSSEAVGPSGAMPVVGWGLRRGEQRGYPLGIRDIRHLGRSVSAAAGNGDVSCKDALSYDPYGCCVGGTSGLNPQLKRDIPCFSGANQKVFDPGALDVGACLAPASSSAPAPSGNQLLYRVLVRHRGQWFAPGCGRRVAGNAEHKGNSVKPVPG